MSITWPLNCLLGFAVIPSVFTQLLVHNYHFSLSLLHAHIHTHSPSVVMGTARPVSRCVGELWAAGTTNVLLLATLVHSTYTPNITHISSQLLQLQAQIESFVSTRIQTCHATYPGRCYPCVLTVDITCCCGSTKVEVPCGRERAAKPPRCRELCK